LTDWTTRSPQRNLGQGGGNPKCNREGAKHSYPPVVDHRPRRGLQAAGCGGHPPEFTALIEAMAIDLQPPAGALVIGWPTRRWVLPAAHPAATSRGGGVQPAMEDCDFGVVVFAGTIRWNGSLERENRWLVIQCRAGRGSLQFPANTVRSTVLACSRKDWVSVTGHKTQCGSYVHSTP
jgi:hypothetical protein